MAEVGKTAMLAAGAAHEINNPLTYIHRYFRRNISNIQWG